MPQDQRAERLLKGWGAIARFLGQPVNVAQRWKREGMPVRREGRNVVALPDELNGWLGREAGEPVHVVRDSADLAGDLRRGLAFVRQKRGPSKQAKRRKR